MSIEKYLNEYSYLGDKIIIFKNENLTNMQYSLIKCLLLSECDYLIGNPISTFIECAYWFGDAKAKFYPVENLFHE